LTWLDAQLADDRSRAPAGVTISLLVGLAGIGKTALAVRWAHRVADRFGDGQVYLDLRGFAADQPVTPIQALAALLRAFGADPATIPADPHEAAARYRSLLAGKRVLVVLDNAANPAQVRPLLPGSPSSAVVVTSRDRLDGLVAQEGAGRLTLGPLPPPAAVALLGGILGQRRTGAEPEALAALAELCGQLPLALRIAAANLASQPSRSVAQYVEELSQGNRLDRLAFADDRHGAVRAAFDLSFAKLPADGRRLFTLLGAVPGPDISQPATAALAGTTPERARRLLDRLAAAHLVEQPVAGRFTLHDLLRLYAAERLGDQGAKATAEALDRLLGWYLQGADQAAHLLYPRRLRLPVPEPAPSLPVIRLASAEDALAWLDQERSNLVAATQHAADQKLGPLAWLLADTLRGYFISRRHLVDWLAVAHAGLAAAVAAGDRTAMAAAQLSLGDAHHSRGDYQEAIGRYQIALAQHRQAGWVEGEAATLCNLGLVHQDLGQLRQAADYQARALTLNQRTRQRQTMAANLGNLGLVEWELGQLRQAADHQQQALALFRRLGSSSGEANTLGNLGDVYHLLGDFDAALDCQLQALALHRRVGQRDGETNALNGLAAIHRDSGNLTAALEYATAALALAGQTGHQRAEAETLNTLGTVHQALGEHRHARQRHQQALELAGSTGARYPQAEALLGLASASRQLDGNGSPAGHARRALAIAEAVGYQVLCGQAHTTLADTHLAGSRIDLARSHAERALGIHRRTGYRLGQARTLLLLGATLTQAQQHRAARSRYHQAATLFDQLGRPEANLARTLSETP
jgi:tetratricopeptide (TPR) repeat protein